MPGIVDLLVFSSAHYGLIFLLALISYVIGQRLTRACIFNSGWEKTVFSTSLGLGFIACVIFALGLLHLLYKEIIISVLFLITILCVLAWKEVRQDIFELFATLWTRKLWLILGVLCALFFLSYFLLPLYPPTAFDATMYHLPSAKAYAQNHSLVFLPLIRFSLFPQINEMLFSLMLILSGDVAAQLVQFFMMSLIALGLYAWGQRLFNPRVGCWAAALWLSSPLVVWAGTSAYIDIGFACFIFFGVYAFSNWMDTDETQWLVLSAAFFGFAAAAKYSALFFLALFGLIIILREIKKRRFKQIALFTIIVALIAGPWYLRSYYYTGNPVFPFFPSIFGYGFLSENEVHALIKDMITGYGTDKTLGNFLILPWNLTFKSTLFHAEALITPMYLLGLPIVFFFSIVHSRIRKFLILIVLYVIFWFSSSQVLRYLIPIFPFLSLAVAASLDMLAEKTKIFRKPRWQSVVAISVAIALISPGWLYALYQIRRLGMLPANTEQRDLFLNKKAPGYVALPYGAIDYLNKLRGSDYAIYALYAENMPYFVDGIWRGGDWFGPGNYSHILNTLSSGETLYQELRLLGVDYFLFTTHRYQAQLPDDQNFYRRFRMIYAKPGIQLFELAKQGIHYKRLISQVLLRNSSFEELKVGKPVGWEEFGNPLTALDTTKTGRGLTALGDTKNFFLQSVRIRPNLFYTLSAFMKAKNTPGTGRLHINWLDHEGHLVRVDIEDVKVGTEWVQYSMTTMAPEVASTACVVADVYGENAVLFDDFSLLEIEYTQSASMD